MLEKPITYNTAILYNEQHSRFDALAEEKRLAIVNAPDSELSITGTAYYISATGDDAADGKSPATAWRTMQKLQHEPDMFQEGDAVLFERGGVYRGRGFIRSGVTYAAYGEGPKPCLYGSWHNYADASLWAPTERDGVWKIHLPEEDTDIGNIIFDHGVACGRKRLTNELDIETAFYFSAEEQTLYLKHSAGNPGEMYADIELAAHFTLLHSNKYWTHDVLIENLCIKYAGCHGIQFLAESDRITVRNCEIGYIGGCMLYWTRPDGTKDAARFGNGFEMIDSGRDIVVENNWVYQCFDAGITHQSGSPAQIEVNRLRFADNLLEYSPYNIEYYDNKDLGMIYNSVYENNIMRFAGFGYGTLDRFGSSTIVVAHVSAYYRPQPCENMVIRNNIMDTSYRHLVCLAYPNDPEGRGPTIEGNVYVQSPFENDDTVADVAMACDAAVVGWQAFPDYTYYCNSQEEMEASVAKIDRAPKAVYFDA